MKAKGKRPAVLELESLIVRDTADAAGAIEAKVEPKAAPAKGEAAMLRTSMLYHRAVHDVLRSIAFEERCSITDLVNEGLDHVLTKRNFPTIKDLKRNGA